MKIAVIAANGRSGRLFVDKALAAGHSVRAGVHRTNKLAAHDRLSVVSCDATDPDDLSRLVEGQDVVVSFIGHVKGSPPDVQTDSTRALVEAMRKCGLRRVVSLTGTGVRFAGDKITFVDRILNFGISMIDPARVNDGRKHVEVLKQSGLDWTVIRVLKLQNTKPHPYELLENGPTKPYVSRQEVAEAVLQVIEQGSFICQAPIIGRAKKQP